MAKKVEPYLINKFLQNTCTPEEAEAVVNYFNDHPAALNDYFDGDEWGKLSITKKLSPQKQGEIKRAIDEVIFEKKKVFSIGFFRYAAAAVVLGTIALAAFFMMRPQKPAATIVKNVQQFMIYNNAVADLDTLLPDGSLVKLSPQAKIFYTGNFGNNRTVNVTGEVLFEEKKIAGKPFVVLAQGIATTPIGTKFLVNSAAPLKTVQVTLLEGNVKVSSAQADKKMNEVYLTPGQSVFINVETMAINIKGMGSKEMQSKSSPAAPQKKETVASSATVWTNTSIRFRQAALPAVMDKISARYNVPIVYDKNEIGNYHFTGDVYYEDDVKKLVQNICDVNRLEFTFHNDTIFINKKGHTP